jgi:serpin B
MVRRRDAARRIGGAAHAEPELGMNAFAWSLYAELAAERQNLFFAPLSVAAALAMAAEGARGETAREMAEALGLGAELRRDDAQRPYAWTPVHARLAADVDALQRQIDPTELRFANALWLERTFAIERPYLDVVARHYGTGSAMPVDFRHDPDGCRATINAWVAARTNGRIVELLAPGMVDEATRLVLTNAVSFVGEWLQPFDVGRTQDGTFRLPGGAGVAVKLMRGIRQDGVRYAAFTADGAPFPTPARVDPDDPDAREGYPAAGFQLVELPYRGGRLAMQVILPATVDGLPALERRLNAANLERWSAALESRDVDVTLPRFRLEVGAELSDALQRLGIRRAFVDTAHPSGGAQFDGISTSSDPARRLYIGAVVHRAFVQVDEQGTEAAAATAVAMFAGTALPTTVPFTPRFVADRPFVFLVRDTRSGAVVFAGRLVRPDAT